MTPQEYAALVTGFGKAQNSPLLSEKEQRVSHATEQKRKALALKIRPAEDPSLQQFTDIDRIFLENETGVFDPVQPSPAGNEQFAPFGKALGDEPLSAEEFAMNQQAASLVLDKDPEDVTRDDLAEMRKDTLRRAKEAIWEGQYTQKVPDIGTVEGEQGTALVNPVTGTDIYASLGGQRDNAEFHGTPEATVAAAAAGVEKRGDWRTPAEFMKDMKLTLVDKGIVGLQEMGYAIADFVSKNNMKASLINTVEDFTEVHVSSLDELLGLSPKFEEERKEIDKGLSDVTREQKAVVTRDSARNRERSEARINLKKQLGIYDFTAKAEEVVRTAGNTVQSYVENPAALIDEAGSSVLPMIATGALGRVVSSGMLGAKFAKMSADEIEDFMKSDAYGTFVKSVGTKTGVTSVALQEATSNYTAAMGKVMAMKEETLLEFSPAYNDMRAEGKTHKQAQRVLADAAANIAAAVSGTVGALSSKMTGAASFEGNMFNKLFRPGSKISHTMMGLMSKSANAGFKELPEEAIQGAAGQIGVDLGTSAADTRIDPGDPVTIGEGLGTGAVVGFTAGAGMAGAGGTPGAIRDVGVIGTAKVLTKQYKKQTARAALIMEALKAEPSKAPSDAVSEHADIHDDLTPEDRKENLWEASYGLDDLIEEAVVISDETKEAIQENSTQLERDRKEISNLEDRRDNMLAHADEASNEDAEEYLNKAAELQASIDYLNEFLPDENEATKDIDAKISKAVDQLQGMVVTNVRDNARAREAALGELSDPESTKDQTSNIRTIAADLVLRAFGSVPLDDYDESLANPDFNPEVRELIEDAQAIQEAEAELRIKTRKNVSQVSGEIRNDMANEMGKKGAKAHSKDITEAIQAGDLPLARERLKSLNDFIKIMEAKKAAIDEAVATGKPGDKISWSPYSKQNPMTLYPGGATKKFAENTLAPEIALLKAQQKFLQNAGKDRFGTKDNPKTDLSDNTSVAIGNFMKDSRFDQEKLATGPKALIAKWKDKSLTEAEGRRLVEYFKKKYPGKNRQKNITTIRKLAGALQARGVKLDKATKADVKFADQKSADKLKSIYAKLKKIDQENPAEVETGIKLDLENLQQYTDKQLADAIEKINTYDEIFGIDIENPAETAQIEKDAIEAEQKRRTEKPPAGTPMRDTFENIVKIYDEIKVANGGKTITDYVERIIPLIKGNLAGKKNHIFSKETDPPKFLAQLERHLAKLKEKGTKDKPFTTQMNNTIRRIIALAKQIDQTGYTDEQWKVAVLEDGSQLSFFVKQFRDNIEDIPYLRQQNYDLNYLVGIEDALKEIFDKARRNEAGTVVDTENLKEGDKLIFEGTIYEITRVTPKRYGISAIEGDGTRKRLNRDAEGITLPEAPTASEAAKNAAKNAADALNKATDALTTMFGGGTLKSGIAFSPESYKRALPIFKEAWKSAQAVGQDIKDFVAALKLKNKDFPAVAPLLDQFEKDVTEGNLDVAPREVADQVSLDELQDAVDDFDITAYEDYIMGEIPQDEDLSGQESLNDIMARIKREQVNSMTEEENEQAAIDEQPSALEVLMTMVKEIKAHPEVKSKNRKLIDDIYKAQRDTKEGKLKGIKGSKRLASLQNRADIALAPVWKYPVGRITNAMGGPAARTTYFQKLLEIANIPYKTAEQRKKRDSFIDNAIHLFIEKGGTLAFKNTVINGSYSLYREIGFPDAKQSLLLHSVKNLNGAMRVARGVASSIIGSIPDFGILYSFPKTAAKINKDLGLNPEQSQQLRALMKWAGVPGKPTRDLSELEDQSKLTFSEAFYNLIHNTVKFDNMYSRNMFNHFRDKEGRLPANLVTASAMVALNYLATRGTDSLFRDKRGINTFLGKNTNDFISPAVTALLSEAGVPRNDLATHMGREIRRMMNVMANEDTNGHHDPKIDLALGLTMLSTLEHMGLVKFNHVRRTRFNELTMLPDDLAKIENNSKELINFVTLAQVKRSDDSSLLLPDGENMNIIGQFKSFSPIFKDLFNLNNFVKLPSDTEPHKVAKKMKGTVNKVSEVMRKAVKYAQSVKFQVNKDGVALIGRMSKGNILAMTNYNTDWENIHDTAIESTKARNKALERELNFALEFIAKRDWDKPFYFTYNIIKNMRAMIDSNTINPQNSKIHRYIFGARKWRQKIKLKGKNSKAYVQNLKLALVESIGMGADRYSIEERIAYFDTHIMDSKGNVHADYAPAIEAILSEGTKDLSDDAQTAIVERVKLGGKKIHSLYGLVALAQFSKARKNKEDSVTIDLPREIDGTTNGPVIGTWQLAPSLEQAKRVLRAGGIFFEGDPWKTYAAWKANPEHKDNYEALAVVVDSLITEQKNKLDKKSLEYRQFQALEKLMKPMVTYEFRDFVDDNGIKVNRQVRLISKEARDMNKDPLLTSGYGAGMASIMSNMLGFATEDFYENLMDIRNDQEKLIDVFMDLDVLLRNGDATRAEVAKELDSIDVKQFDMAKAGLSTKDNPNVAFSVPGAGGTKKTFSVQERFYEAVEEYYGRFLKIALHEQLGKYSKNRAMMISAIRFMNEVFVAEYGIRMARAMEEAGGLPPSAKEEAKIVSDLRNEGIMPTIKHATSVDDENHTDSLQLTKATSDIVPNEKGGKQQQEYAQSVTSHELDVDKSNNVFVKDTVDSPQMAGNIMKRGFMTNPGVGGMPGTNISNDANINAYVMQKMQMLNLFDAGMYGIMDTDKGASIVNDAMWEIMSNWSMAKEVAVSLKRAEKHFFNFGKFPKGSPEKTAYDSIINSVDKSPFTITPTRYDINKNKIKAVNYKSIPAFLAAFASTEKDIENVKTLIDDKVRVVTNYPNIGSEKVIDPDTSTEDSMTWREKNLKANMKKLFLSALQKEELARSLSPIKNGVRIAKAKTNVNQDTLLQAWKINMPELGGLLYVIERTTPSGPAWKIAHTASGVLFRTDYPSKEAAHQGIIDNILESGGVDEFISDVNHSVDGIVQESKNANVDSTDGHGSIPGSTVNFKYAHEGERALNADTVQDIFDRLLGKGRVNDDIGHQNRLQEILTNLIQPALKELKDFTYHYGSTVKDGAKETAGLTLDQKIYVASAKGEALNTTEKSSQETFVHEMIHAILRTVIDNNPRVRREMKRLYRIAEREFRKQKKPWEMFLRRDEQGNLVQTQPGEVGKKAEEKAAKKMYDYIFDTKMTDNSYLHEFATHGLTNKAVVEALEKFDNKSMRDIKSGTVVGRLKQLFLMGVDWLNGHKYRTNNKSVAGALRNLANDVNNIETSNLQRIDNAYARVQWVNTAVKMKIADFMTEVYAPSVEKVVDIKDKNLAMKTMANIYTLPYNLWISKTYKKSLDNWAYTHGFTMRNFVASLMTEIGGANKFTQPFHDLLRDIKHLVDYAVEEESRSLASHIKDSFDPENMPTKQEWRHLNSILKTDLVSLMGIYTGNELLELIRNGRELNKRIRQVERDLKAEFPDLHGYYRIQGKSLGMWMAQGKAGVANQMLNAWLIANLKTTGKEDMLHQVTPINTERAERLIETLATLSAIKNTDGGARKTMAKFMESEHARKDENGRKLAINGIDFLMSAHRDFKETSLDQLFYGDKTWMIKGYTKEQYDDFYTMKVGTREQALGVRRWKTMPSGNKVLVQEPGFLDEGYTEYAPVSHDNNSGLHDDLYIYTSNQGLTRRRVTAIVSNIDKQGKGTSINDMYANEGLVNNPDALSAKEFFQHRRNTRQEVEAQFAGYAKLNFENNYMIPSLDDNQEIGNYRYMMDEQTKIHALKKDDQAHIVMGRMSATIINKTNSRKGNRQYLVAAKKDSDDNYADDKRRFVLIGPKVKDPELREKYKMLPSDMKEDMKEIWGGNEFLVREETLALAFGFRKPSLTEYVNKFMPMPIFMKTAFRLAGQIWQGLISKLKNVIVILIPDVVSANQISNMIITMMMGVPPSYMAKRMAEAVAGLNQYNSDRAELLRLEREIKLFPGHQGIVRKRTKVVRLKQDIEKNPVTELIDAGLFQSIIEDITEKEDTFERAVKNTFSFADQGAEYLEKMVPDVIKNGYKQLVISKDTELNEALTAATRYSDFIARYALFKWQTRGIEGMSEKDAKQLKLESIRNVVDTFVNYDVPTSAEMQWMNDMGILMFTKFLFRIQRVILRSVSDNPVNATMLMLTQQALGELPTIGDSNLWSTSFHARMSYPYSPDTVDDTFNFNLFNFLWPF